MFNPMGSRHPPPAALFPVVPTHGGMMLFGMGCRRRIVSPLAQVYDDARSGSKTVPVSKVSDGLDVAQGEKVFPVRRSLKSPLRSAESGTVERYGALLRSRDPW